MHWYHIILILLGGLILTFLVYNLILIISSAFVNPHREYETDSPYYRSLLVGATYLLMWFCRIHVDLEGRDRLPQGRYLLVCNHRSDFDPLITWVVLNKEHLSFISKEKNFKIFIFGRLIRRCAFMAIDREDPRKAMKTIQKAARLMKEDVVSVAVYPEGKRNFERELLPFRNGCMKAAKMAGVPVVVMTMEGTHKIHKNFPWKSSRIKMTICDVISAEEVKNLKTQEIGDRARASMENILKGEDY